MKKLLCFLGGALLLLQVHGQEKIEPFYIGDRVPDLTLYRILNYKDSITKFSSFGEKLIILDFWSIHCGACIEIFPTEDSLQRIYSNSLQFVLVTFDRKKEVISFLKRYDSIYQKPLCMPVIYGDSVLYHLFRHHSIPHCVWIAPDGMLLAQTSQITIDANAMQTYINKVMQYQHKLHTLRFPENMYSFPKLPKDIADVLRFNKAHLQQ